MSYAALFFSLLAIILLLSIVTARYHVIDFFTNLPSRLFLGMSFMFMSIMCMWISFCSSISLLLIQPTRNVYDPLYIFISILSIPCTIFAITKFPVYWNLLSSRFYKTPAHSHNLVPARPNNLPEKKLTCDEALNRLVKISEDYDRKHGSKTEFPQKEEALSIQKSITIH
ncbi:hypothetical protein K1719_039531 [Acacia pycnantha]|nr:hypothetical protein K1719_039531 [Acacia pycnantha]